MKRIDLEAEFRERCGKGPARQIRREGKIPAVLYGKGKSTLLTLIPADLLKILRSGSGENTLINLKIKGQDRQGTATAILRDYQKEPVTWEILHADLFEVSMEEAIHVKVPLVLKGEAVGVKEGGVLQYHLRELEIECLPALIPDQIEVDATHLAIGQSVHVKDLPVAEGIRVLTAADEVVVSVAAPISEEKLSEILAGPTAAAEVKEPEVLARGKEKEGEEASAEEAKPGEKTEKPEKAEKAEKTDKAGKAEAKPEKK